MEQQRAITLPELFGAEQAAEIETLIKRIRTGEVQMDNLRFYFRACEEQLRPHEIDPNYLFYAVAYAYNLF